jgi:hypothetical protein
VGLVVCTSYLLVVRRIRSDGSVAFRIFCSFFFPAFFFFSLCSLLLKVLLLACLFFLSQIISDLQEGENSSKTRKDARKNVKTFAQRPKAVQGGGQEGSFDRRRYAGAFGPVGGLG